jgi:hypothetical protein
LEKHDNASDWNSHSTAFWSGDNPTNRAGVHLDGEWDESKFGRVIDDLKPFLTGFQDLLAHVIQHVIKVLDLQITNEESP